MSHLYPEKYHLCTNDVILEEKWGWSDCEIRLECGSSRFGGPSRTNELTQ